LYLSRWRLGSHERLAILPSADYASRHDDADSVVYAGMEWVYGGAGTFLGGLDLRQDRERDRRDTSELEKDKKHEPMETERRMIIGRQNEARERA
jgi:hypothetical protein